ncbi:MFS transporter [Nocardia vaccinii]|uniref:MFS transporter n=1 Tax=Nocardia vaccinii TaxID=1822 RepID=UPI000836FEC5|nr:MFS transporter [Nocardia vaccinii]
MSTTETSPPPDHLDSPVENDTGRLDGASRVRIFAILIVIVLYTEVVPLQYTMVSAALQKMTKTFSTVGGNINWAVIILGLVGAAATPLIGKASDAWGKKKLFLATGVCFFVGCVICALTSNWTIFLIGRGLAAFSIASQVVAYGLIRDLIPRKYIPLGVGMIGAGLGFSGAIAPLIGGFLVDHFEWRAMFWFLAAFTLMLTPLVIWVVPETKLRVRERFDPFGAILLSAGALFTLLYLDNGQTWGWGRPSALAWLIGGLVMLALFVVVEFRVSRPIMDMKLLVNPKVSLTLLMTAFGVGITAVQPLALGYMTQTPNVDGLRENVVQGVVAQAHQMTGMTLPASLVHVNFDPGYTYGNGFSMLGYALHVGIWAGLLGMVVGPFAGAMARRLGARIPAILAFSILTISGIGFVVFHYSWITYLVLYLLAGIGFGCFYAAGPNLIMDAVPQEQQGISAGMLGVTMSMGSAICMAVTTALLNNHPVKAHIDVMGHSTVQTIPQVFADRGYTLSFWVVLATTIVALIIAVLMRHGRSPATGGAPVTSEA